MRDRRGTATRRAALAAAIVGALALGACASGGSAPPAAGPGAAQSTPSVASPGAGSPTVSAVAAAVRLEIHQQRGDVAGGFVELRVTNEGGDELVVERATYESRAWAAPMERVDEARIPPGARRNLRLELPEPTCADGAVEHRATLELADGTIVEGEPADPLGQLDALDDAVCDLRAFERDVAMLSWLEPRIPADGNGPSTLRLEVAPVAGGGESLGSLDEVLSTPLLVPVDAGGGRLAELAIGLGVVAGAAPTIVEVPVEPGRCDLHAVAEDKQGTLFRIRATMPGRADPVLLVLPSPDAQRDALLGFVVASCAA